MPNDDLVIGSKRRGGSNVRVQGRIFEDGGFWLAEVPMLDAMTQGTSKADALDMVKDVVETLANRPGFSATVHSCADGNIELGSDDVRGLVALILHRHRTRNGLSLPEAARRLGAKSADAYARYERGESSPTLEKLSELMAAVSPGCDFVLQRGVAH